MRILQVRFKNLNSLVGEWEIDLTHPAFASDGIFAITGPTGSGKTTILDAICLALYGRTPRLDKVTKSANEIMSRRTGDCFAEVTFETQTGRYRSHWGQHRARKKPDGELQPPKHEIADAESGEIYESKIRDVALHIETTTGMDFDRFTRSMLLAQGGFAAFLQAAPDYRAPILEQITGTEIYSRISIRVHESLRDEREKLKILNAETQGIVILEPEQEKEIQHTLESNQKKDADLAAKTAETRKAIEWLTKIDGLKKEIISLTDEAGELQNHIDAFEPDRNKLNWALRAASLDGRYATLTATRKQQVDDQKALKTEEETLPELEASSKKHAESLKSAQNQTIKAKEELKAAAPIIKKVRSLDQKLADQQKAVLDGEESCRKVGAEIDKDKKARLECRKRSAEAQDKLELVEGYLKEHAQDEWLISGLAGVEERLEGLLSTQKEIAQKEAAREKAVTNMEQATKSLDHCLKQCGIRKKELDKASKQLQQSKAALSRLLGDRLLREHRAEKETLLREMAFLRKIGELEDHRAKLEDGKPCPLCGATEHPFAEGNIPVPDDIEQKIEKLTELISQAEDQEAAMEKLRETEASARNNLTEAEKRESAASNEKNVAEKALAELQENLKKIRADFAERKQAVSDKLLPLGVEEIPDDDVSSLLGSLRERLNAWQAQVKKKTQIEKQINELDGEVKRLDAVIETKSTSLAENRELLETLKKELAAVGEERKTLYGEKNPDNEEVRLNKAVLDAESAEKRARDLHDELQQKWNTAKANVESLKKRINNRESELIRLESDFSEALKSVSFSDEKEFIEARLLPEQRKELDAKAKELDQRQTDLKARQKDRETRLATEMAQKVTNKSLDELKPQLDKYEESLKELRDIIAGLKHKLNENAAAKERIKEKQTAIEAQQRECNRWENLHELIGSADGKKYRNFAQGLTFEMMIGYANRQLQKMTDRYLLVRDDAQPLELNVIDSYQAGEIRSTKNLSGGESFIVSLSLALGLSQMASKNVRVDSLFLDEGFGTLDEEALDTALETLAGLQQDGKLIGVISHVQALKERISTQIQITPQTGGRSRISGPGCSLSSI